MSADELRQQLSGSLPSLRPIAVDVLTESSDSGRIDLVALDADGAAVACFDVAGDDLAGFTRALAGAAWLEAHLPDWQQIAPELGIELAHPVRSLLVAPSFASETRAAASRVGEAVVELLELAPAPGHRDMQAGSRPIVSPRGAPMGPLAATPPGPRPAFRTGLTDADIGVHDAAR